MTLTRFAGYASPGTATGAGRFGALLDPVAAAAPGKAAMEALGKLAETDFFLQIGLAETGRAAEMDIRSVAGKLGRLAERGKEGPRLLCNCRDLSLLLCAAYRRAGRPARVRSGFAAFFDPAKKFDHWICERFDASGRWIAEDPWVALTVAEADRLPEGIREMAAGMALDPFDVDGAAFLSGGAAWEACAAGDDPGTYGTYEPELRGAWFVRDNMVRDLRCLAKDEPLPWELGPGMGREVPSPAPGSDADLDAAARLSAAAPFEDPAAYEGRARPWIGGTGRT